MSLSCPKLPLTQIRAMYYVPDIIQPNSKFIIILESPHKDEVKTGAPLSGASGIAVSRVLFSKQEPLGLIVRTHNLPCSIINTFQCPIKFGEKENMHPLLSQIREIKYEYEYEPQKYKKAITEAVNKNQENDELIDDYKKRLLDAGQYSEAKKLIICGLIAQAIFESAFDIDAHKIRYATPHNLNIPTFPVRIFYIRHPSPKSGSWQEGSREVVAMKQLIEQG